MKKYSAVLAVVGAFFVLAVGARIGYSQAKPASGTVQVHMVITDQAVNDDSEMPALTAGNVQVKQGKDVLKVDQVIPARDDNGALQLFILIDETCDTGIGNNLNDLRDFINAQPATTMVGIAYMSNATVQVAQNLTVDHAAASKAVRLPRGNLSSMDSPYLSLISLVKSWPQSKVRREVLMVTDGIDRLRGASTASGFSSPVVWGACADLPPQRCPASVWTRTQRAPRASVPASLFTPFTRQASGGTAGTLGKHSLANLGSPKSRMRPAESTSRWGHRIQSASNLTWIVCRRSSTINISWYFRPYRKRKTGFSESESPQQRRTSTSQRRITSGFRGLEDSQAPGLAPTSG